jgi:hypothetical protein
MGNPSLENKCTCEGWSTWGGSYLDGPPTPSIDCPLHGDPDVLAQIYRKETDDDAVDNPVGVRPPVADH